MVHSDIYGPMSVRSFSRARYFVSFIDEYSGYICIVPISRKSQVLEEFKLYQAWVEKKFYRRIERLQCDGGSEFVAMRAYLREQGIELSMSPPYSPNMNPIAERVNRTIVECARSMLNHSSSPRKFWAEALVHVVKIRNLFLCPRNNTKSSYELLSGRKPDAGHLRVFGCLGWHHIANNLRKTLDAKYELGIIIGCFENSQ